MSICLYLFAERQTYFDLSLPFSVRQTAATAINSSNVATSTLSSTQSTKSSFATQTTSSASTMMTEQDVSKSTEKATTTPQHLYGLKSFSRYQSINKEREDFQYSIITSHGTVSISICFLDCSELQICVAVCYDEFTKLCSLYRYDFRSKRSGNEQPECNHPSTNCYKKTQ